MTLTTLPLLFAVLSFATTTSEVVPEAVAVAYLESFEDSGSEGAFERLMECSRLDELMPREMKLMKSQIEQVSLLYGPSLGVEEVEREVIIPSLLKLTYLTKHRDLPLLWVFIFYRVEDEWSLLQMSFNDQLEGL